MLKLIIYIILAILVGSAAYVGLSTAPWLPTLKREKDKMIELADIQPGDNVYDLGCGDGRFLVASKNRYPKCNVYGIELSLLPYIISKLRVKGKVIFGNLFKQDLSNADVVFVFLMKRIYPKLKDKLEKELKQGTRVIVSTWGIDGWEVEKKISSKNNVVVYLYKMK
ncbi:SAM-dependent methyltransferase [bacterium]|jgi:SAM-dependent methyltransferase|nr:SAM-dependent methyltransferase [bacterium]